MRKNDLLKRAAKVVDGADELATTHSRRFGAAMPTDIVEAMLWLLDATDDSTGVTPTDGFVAAADDVAAVAERLQAAVDRQGLSISLTCFKKLRAALSEFDVAAEAEELFEVRVCANECRQQIQRLRGVLCDQRDGTDDLLIIPEVARRLQIRREDVDQLISCRKLQVVDISVPGTKRKRIRVTQQALRQFLEASVVAEKPPKTRRKAQSPTVRQWI